ncbi:T-cell receptor gamma chain C region 5/10-13 [Fukomys damarensis]|nr:T-cell receptor gamma chain C region 5/10-13 [Fukomys damarensis]
MFLPSVAETNIYKAGTYLCLLEKIFPEDIKVFWKEKDTDRILESQQGDAVKINDTYIKLSWLTVAGDSLAKEHKLIVQHENNKGRVDQKIVFPPIKKGLLSLQLTSTSAYYIYLLLLLKSALHGAFLTFCLYRSCCETDSFGCQAEVLIWKQNKTTQAEETSSVTEINSLILFNPSDLLRPIPALCAEWSYFCTEKAQAPGRKWSHHSELCGADVSGQAGAGSPGGSNSSAPSFSNTLGHPELHQHRADPWGGGDTVGDPCTGVAGGALLSQACSVSMLCQMWLILGRGSKSALPLLVGVEQGVVRKNYIHWYQFREGQIPGRLLYEAFSQSKAVLDSELRPGKYNAYQISKQSNKFVVLNVEESDSGVYLCAVWAGTCSMLH